MYRTGVCESFSTIPWKAFQVDSAALNAAMKFFQNSVKRAGDISFGEMASKSG
jgi:hypothetical protein